MMHTHTDTFTDYLYYYYYYLLYYSPPRPPPTPVDKGAAVSCSVLKHEKTCNNLHVCLWRERVGRPVGGVV